ncbi:MAG TPA: hypothetical protein VF796_18730 [Humisphaera sp.]
MATMGAAGGSAAWVPPAGLTDFLGQPLAGATDFFHPPPPEIGPLVAAQSNLKAGKVPMSAGTRNLLIGAGVLAGVLLAVVIGSSQRGPNNPVPVPMGIIGGAVGAVMSAVAIVNLTKYVGVCGYVGRDGVALYAIKGSKSSLAEAHVLRFDAAEEVRTWQVYITVNGVPSVSAFHFEWLDQAGAVAFRVAGAAPRPGARPSPNNVRYLLGQAAHTVWNERAWARLAPALAAGQPVTFRIGKAGYARLEPGAIDVKVRDKQGRIVPDPYETAVSANNGTVTLSGPSADKPGKSLKFSFEHRLFGNAHLFFQCCERRWGLTVQ